MCQHVKCQRVNVLQCESVNCVQREHRAWGGLLGSSADPLIGLEKRVVRVKVSTCQRVKVSRISLMNM